MQRYKSGEIRSPLPLSSSYRAFAAADLGSRLKGGFHRLRMSSQGGLLARSLEPALYLSLSAASSRSPNTLFLILIIRSAWRRETLNIEKRLGLLWS